jgi:GDPmannose 4,6-dehydratase
MDNCLYLGNLDAKRDWGHAKDYVEGMYLILQQEKPEDFVLATGITTSVRDFVRKSFLELGIEVIFEGSDENEVAKVVKCTGPSVLEIGKVVVEVDPKYYRPTEVDLLIGDATKANEKLGWTPKYNLDELVKEMVNSDYNKSKSKINNNV